MLCYTLAGTLALSLGVPMVAMPQRTDQSTNAKYITGVWNMGVKAVVDENGILLVNGFGLVRP